MAVNDHIYYFEQTPQNKWKMFLLGEIQSNFNMSFVIDGTKDSMKVEINSFLRDALRPNTIIWHKANNTWWVVRKDNVKRNAHEVGFYYNHSLALTGAIELLVSRDLTDCGFNANNYTIDTFLKKLFKLSNFEFEYSIEYGDNIDKDQKVDYIKSYENYTLLSALRDFLNGYNCEIKLDFSLSTQGNDTFINEAQFTIIPRTGNIDLTPINISEFGDIRESINFNKESYGTTVISNAKNVVSTLAKTYPQVGGVTLTGTDYNTSLSGAYIKLPSPAWKVNWVKARCPLRIALFSQPTGVPSVHFELQSGYAYYNQYETAINDFIYKLSLSSLSADDKNAIGLFILANKDKIKELYENSSVTFYNNPTYNPRVDLTTGYGTIVKEDTTPYIPILSNLQGNAHQVGLMDKESARLLKSSSMSLTWERGSDKIEGMMSIMGGVFANLLAPSSDLRNLDYLSLQLEMPLTTYSIFVIYDYVEGGLDAVEFQAFSQGATIFQVNYIPMGDLKIKQDNENNTQDIQLYNQNGKLNDSVALSKSIDSYSKEIANQTITRYMHYTKFSDIPKVGQIVLDGNKKYVINNISYDFEYNELKETTDTTSYYIECEFSLAEYISTKSIMTSPNTNIRDYLIPQNYNVKRRQVYRDYYEFDLHEEPLANQETPYAPIDKYVLFDVESVNNNYDHTALIKIDYSRSVSGKYHWYYQLNSTTYSMAKSIYEVIDFGDNNIIGYDIQNTTTGFNMSDLWSPNYRAVTTPVSYVDDYGMFTGVTLRMVSAEKLQEIYENIDVQGNTIMLSAHCFIDRDLYDLAIYKPTSSYFEDVAEMEIDQDTASVLLPYVIDVRDFDVPSGTDFTNATLIDTEVSCVETGEVLDSSDYEIITRTSNDQIEVDIDIINPYSVVGLTSANIKLKTKVQYIVYYTDNIDYTLEELDYNKDPIEVPVFEYSLQLGDSKEVEVGDNFFKGTNGLCLMFESQATDDEITLLNASRRYIGEPAASGGVWNSTLGYREYSVVCSYFTVMSFEENNTKLRIKFYDAQRVKLHGNEDQSVITFYEAPTLPSVQVSKNAFIGKNIIISRNVIKSAHRNDITEQTSVDYDRDIMFVIHKPTEDNFDGNDLIIDVNYYKLK